MSSQNTTDPSDILQTVQTLQMENIRVSIIGLSAEIYICKYISELTGGEYNIAQNFINLKELILSYVAPPIQIDNSNDNLIRKKYFERRWVHVGFPSLEGTNSSIIESSSQNSNINDINNITIKDTNIQEDNLNEQEYLGICICHCTLQKQGYRCPRCGIIVCDLPTVCNCCKLTMVASPQLARSYHHLFPVPLYHILDLKAIKDIRLEKDIVTPNVQYVTINENNDIYNINTVINCTSCRVILKINENIICLCPLCQYLFCLSCDIFIHLNLHNCPGCLSSSNEIHAIRGNLLNISQIYNDSW